MSSGCGRECSPSSPPRKHFLLIKQDNIITSLSPTQSLSNDQEHDYSRKRKRESGPSEEETCRKKPAIDQGESEGNTAQDGYKGIFSKELKIVVNRINFKEVLITTPSKGVREVHYFSLLSDSEDEEEEDDVTHSLAKVKYEDWRVQTIRAFPASTSKNKHQSGEYDEDNTSSSVFLEIPSSQDYIFNVGHAKDDLHSILDILGGDKMSTLIIDGYMILRLKKYYRELEETVRSRLIKEKRPVCPYTLRKSQQISKKSHGRRTSTRPTNFQYLSTNFMPVKDRDQAISTFIPNLKYLPDLTKLWDKSNPAQLIAPLYASKHLYLAVFDVQKKQVYAYDSSWHYLPMPLREGQIQAILKAITNTNSNEKMKNNVDGKHHDERRDETDESSRPASEWKINFVSTSCPQYDEYSCGIFTIHYAENVLKGVAHHKNRWQLSTSRVMQIRRHIVKELLSTTAYGRRFLEAISE